MTGFCRLSLVLLLAASLAACGFQPLMGARNEMITDELARVRVDMIADRSGQILRNQLFDDLPRQNRSEAPLYTLRVTLYEPRQEIAIRRDESASRVAYSAQASFALRDMAGRSLFGGSSVSTSTYEATNSEFASIAAQRSARDRAMQEISADIRQQLAAYFIRAQHEARSAGSPARP